MKILPEYENRISVECKDSLNVRPKIEKAEITETKGFGIRIRYRKHIINLQNGKVEVDKPFEVD